MTRAEQTKFLDDYIQILKATAQACLDDEAVKDQTAVWNGLEIQLLVGAIAAAKAKVVAPRVAMAFRGLVRDQATRGDQLWPFIPRK